MHALNQCTGNTFKNQPVQLHKEKHKTQKDVSATQKHESDPVKAQLKVFECAVL